jgi:two-component system sensor histidine kinase/response regulator
VIELAVSTNLLPSLTSLRYNAEEMTAEQTNDDKLIQAFPAEDSESYTNSSTCPSSCIRFEVKDYGKGIDKKDFTQIFKPFQQASAETERVYGGTGLGLAITAKLVHALGGTISVDSLAGEWSTFTVDLPMRQDPADVDQLSGDLQDVVLYIVEENVEGEKNRRARRDLERILSRFQAKYWRFESLTDLEKHLAIKPFAPATTSAVNKNLTYVCLIQEDLFDPEPYHRISKKIPSVLSTFGPKYSVEQTALHYRSLLKVLPSVLIKSLIELRSGSMTQMGSDSFNSGSSKILRSKVNAVLIRDLRVLIAEDNLVNQKVLSRMLNRLGADPENVDIVDNGEKAVVIEASKIYDLILMDMQMPVMDGIEACRRIVNRSEYVDGRQTPPKVVFVTAHAADSYEDECRKAGGTGFLPKPYNLNDIAKCFQSLQIETR